MKTRLLLMIAFALCLALASSCETHETSEPGLLVPLTVDEDPSLPSIIVNGTQLHAQTFGDPEDPMMVVIHGGPGADYRSLLNCSAFAEDGFFVVFYDQRGSGLSQRHDADIYTVQLFIDDLDAVIGYYRQSPDQKVILMGHSWGAMLATAYVNEYPDLISGLVLMEPGGLTWEDTKDYISRVRTLDPFEETSNDWVYLDQFLTGKDHNLLDYKAGLAVEDNVGNPGPYPYWRFGAVCQKASLEYAEDHPFDFRTNLHRFTTTVLFAYSELNEAYGQAHAELVSSAFPNVQLVRIDGTGHEIPYFGWDNFYPVAQDYLNNIK